MEVSQEMLVTGKCILVTWIHVSVRLDRWVISIKCNLLNCLDQWMDFDMGHKTQNKCPILPGVNKVVIYLKIQDYRSMGRVNEATALCSADVKKTMDDDIIVKITLKMPSLVHWMVSLHWLVSRCSMMGLL